MKQLGIDPDEATRSDHGVSNETWVAADIVLRLSAAPGPGYLSREAAVARLLPLEVGYPRIMEAGLFEGHEYLVAERLPGVNLGAEWSSLTAGDRETALVDVWNRLSVAHGVDTDLARAAGATATPFYALDPAAAAGRLRRLLDRGAIDSALHGQLQQILDLGFDAMSLAPVGLAHTDVHPGNVVWSHPNAVLLDFEFACVAPVDLDLESLCRHFLSWSGDALAPLLRHLIAAQVEVPGGHDRVRSYAVLFDTWALNLWLDTPGDDDSRGPYETWDPLVRLRGHVDGTSWLRQVL